MAQFETDYKGYQITVWTDKQGFWRWVVLLSSTVIHRSGPLANVQGSDTAIARAQSWLDTYIEDQTQIYKGLEIRSLEGSRGWYWDVLAENGVPKANNIGLAGSPTPEAAIARAKAWVDAYRDADPYLYMLEYLIYTWQGENGWAWEVLRGNALVCQSYRKTEGESQCHAIAAAKKWIGKSMHDYDDYETAEQVARDTPLPEPEPIDVPKVSREWLESELQRQKQELAATVKQIESLQASVPVLEGNIAALRQTLVCHASRHTDVKPTA